MRRQHTIHFDQDSDPDDRGWVLTVDVDRAHVLTQGAGSTERRFATNEYKSGRLVHNDPEMSDEILLSAACRYFGGSLGGHKVTIER